MMKARKQFQGMVHVGFTMNTSGALGTCTRVTSVLMVYGGGVDGPYENRDLLCSIKSIRGSLNLR